MNIRLQKLKDMMTGRDILESVLSYYQQCLSLIEETDLILLQNYVNKASCSSDYSADVLKVLQR